MFTKNFKNVLAGFGMSYLNYSTAGIRLKTRAGAVRYLLMNNYASEYYQVVSMYCSATFSSSTSTGYYCPIYLDRACTAHGDSSTSYSRTGMIFSDANGVTEDSYILPGNEFFPLSNFSIAIKSRTMTIVDDDTIQYKVVYTLTSKVTKDTVIGSVGYYTIIRGATAVKTTGSAAGQYLMLAIDLEEPVTIPANSAADLTVTIRANGQAWAEIT